MLTETMLEDAPSLETAQRGRVEWVRLVLRLARADEQMQSQRAELAGATRALTDSLRTGAPHNGEALDTAAHTYRAAADTYWRAEREFRHLMTEEAAAWTAMHEPAHLPID